MRSLEGFVLSAHRAGALDVAFKQMGKMVLDDMALMAAAFRPSPAGGRNVKRWE